MAVCFRSINVPPSGLLKQIGLFVFQIEARNEHIAYAVYPSSPQVSYLLDGFELKIQFVENDHLNCTRPTAPTDTSLGTGETTT